MARKNKVEGTIAVEGARLVFKNFSGAEGMYNAKGKRNFCVLFDQETADNLASEGWNVKYLKPREEDDEPQAYMEVNVGFGAYPPTLILITGQGKTPLTEEAVSLLDWADLEHVDLILRPYNWDINGKTGVKAYIKAGYFTLREDEFASKYYDVPVSAATSLPYVEEGE